MTLFSWWRNSLANLDHSPCSPKTKLFRIEFSDLHVSKEDSIKPRCYQFESQLFEAEYFADEDSILVPANVPAVVDSSQEHTPRICELWQLAWQSDGTGNVETRRNKIV